MNKKRIRGIIFLVVGAVAIIWALNHKPGNALVNELRGLLDDNSYSLSKPWYYGTLIIGGLLALQGLRDFFK